jgi:hypothetical protein
MQGMTRVGLRTYRAHRLEVWDDAGAGWCVVIYRPVAARRRTEALRNHMPNGLEDLMEEARRRVDRALDEGVPTLDRR